MNNEEEKYNYFFLGVFITVWVLFFIFTDDTFGDILFYVGVIGAMVLIFNFLEHK